MFGLDSLSLNNIHLNKTLNTIEEEPLNKLLLIPVVILIALFAINLTTFVFGRLQRKKKKIHLRFFENIIRFFITFFCIIWIFSGFGGVSKIYNLLFGSTIVITAVIGFAGQDIVKDVLSGVILSMSRPFELGDRLIIPGLEKAGTVEDMTLRHVVIRTMDNIRYIIPNNEINDMIITNTSYKQSLRGTYIQIPIAYTADIRKAVNVVREVIMNCPYTFPNNPMNEDLGGYGDVYMMSFEGNSITLETTIWTEPHMDNFLACSEIRMSILEAFRRENIEIPYNYMNVIMRDPEHNRKIEYIDSVKRNISTRSDNVYIRNIRKDMQDCLFKVEQFSNFHNYDKHEYNKLRLIAEELISFGNAIIPREPWIFWLEGNQNVIKYNLKTKKPITRARQLELVKSISDASIPKQFITNLKLALTQNVEPDGWLFESRNLPGDELIEKKLLAGFSDEIKIGIIDRQLMITAEKKMG